MLISDIEDCRLKAPHLDSITVSKPREYFVANDSQMSNPAVGCIHLHIYHMSRILFLILSSLDFVAFVVKTLIFP